MPKINAAAAPKAKPKLTSQGDPTPEEQAAYDAEAEAAQAEIFEDNAPEVKLSKGDVADKDKAAAAKALKAEKVGKTSNFPTPKPGGGLFTKLEDVREYLRLLYWGREGSGKTTDSLYVANLGRVLVVNAEGGLKKKRLAELGINIDNIMIWPKPGEAITHAGLDAVYREIKADLVKDPDSWVGVVFDSATDIVAGMTGLVSDNRILKVSERGVTVDAYQRWETDRNDYGVMGRQFMDILRKFRDLQLHFIVTALERRDVDEDTSKVSYGPAVSPALATSLLGYVDIVIRTAEPDDSVEYYRGLTKAGGKFRTKDRLHALPRVLVEPTMERVLAYVDGDLTDESDPLQRQIVVKVPQEPKPKPLTAAQKRAAAKLAAESEVPSAAEGEGSASDG